MRIELHIGEVVLDGVELGVGGAALLRSAMEGELTALLAADTPSRRLIESDHVAHLATADVRVAHGAPAAATLGRDISRSLHQGLTR